ncbi:MAG TPA: trypsin-like peptidase domain-containing protein [Gaiellales bacterium]
MRRRALLAALPLLLAATACGGAAAGTTAPAASPTVTVTRTVTTTAPASTTRDERTADLVARVLPSVVNVRTVGFDGSKGEASGVVIDRRGVIVTNYHVVKGARTLTVFFDDGIHTRSIRARVIGTATARDLAIIHVPSTNLVPLPLGRSSTLRLGDGVLAIGFPLDLGGGPTVTEGIVSGLDRNEHAEGGPGLKGLLQTDAAINPGNSGGALIDSTGRLVGINTLGANGAQNVGFAIAIDDARPVIEEIRAKPTGKQPWIGITFSSIASASSAAQIGLPPSTRGAAVVAVFSGSPGAKAGLVEGDVVADADGHAVHSSDDLTRLLAGLAPGARLTLDVVDSSGPRRVTVTVAKRPATLAGG